MTNNLLPMLPYDQNKVIFGESMKEPQQVHDAVYLLVKDELERMLGSEIDIEPYQPTTTKLPETSSLGPRKTLEVEANRIYGPQLDELQQLLSAPPAPHPKDISKLSGWVFYPYSGAAPTRVHYPTESVMLFDVETYVRGGGHPVMASALTTQGWYFWLHPQLVKGKVVSFEPELIPVGPGRLLVAHNAMFDASKTVEAYSLSNQDRPASLCTMAMHGTVTAMGGEQVTRAYKSIPANAPLAWMKECCGDSLAACLKHYTGLEVEKEARDIFKKGSIFDIINNLDSLITYQLKDIEALGWLALALYPKFREACPSLITLGGLLELSKSLLVVDKTYLDRVRVNNLLYEMKNKELTKQASKLCGELVQKFVSNPDFEWESDPWLNQLDWTPAKSGKNKGFPLWYRKTLSKGITLGIQVVPLVMRMTWKGQPLIFDKVKKWCWKNPETGNLERLPHPDGEGKNVGSPLSKHFAQFVDSGVLSSDSEDNLPKEITKLSYWNSFNSRFEGQYLMGVDAEKRLGIVPVTKLVGALTGRQVERLWLTAAQCKPGKLGTDMFHVIQPPEGWSMVHWDEDTEEVRIGALWGDFNRGLGIGATAMSQVAFMGVNTGTLETATDAHSVTAKLANISRSEAKTANFRDIFGGGRKTQADAIQTAHPDWGKEQVNGVVTKILDAKRGEKKGGKYEGGTDSFYHNQAAIIAETPDFRLPSTGRKMPNVINPKFDTTGMFYTSRYNFPVQGTGVDILHATALAVRVLADKEGIPRDAWGYVMARHDEIGYNVKDDFTGAFAEIANTAHVWAWAIFIEALGFNWMPTPLARLTAINVDKVYRKDVKAPTDAGYSAGWTFEDGREVN